MMKRASARFLIAACFAAGALAAVDGAQAADKRKGEPQALEALTAQSIKSVQRSNEIDAYRDDYSKNDRPSRERSGRQRDFGSKGEHNESSEAAYGRLTDPSREPSPDPVDLPTGPPLALLPDTFDLDVPPGLPGTRPEYFPRDLTGHPLALYLVGGYRTGDVLVAVPAGTPGGALNALATGNGLAVQDVLQSALLPFTLARLRLSGGQQVHEIVAALGGSQLVLAATPNYIYGVNGETGTTPQLQFAPQRMSVTEAHKVATGNSVKVAIIDTGIDAQHSELAGSVTESFDAVDAGPDAPTRHGTAMAGVIASKVRITGIAPNVEILSARAFAPPKKGGGASGTTYAIIKSMDWAYRAGARVFNLSFAGPKDRLLIQALDALAEHNTIMIGAAGNAGPGKPPAYPAAHAGVIAVTATDQNDALYTMANRGSYVAVAAPGVDIITTTPGGGYEFMSGTSIATAHVTGVVALVLERHPEFKADAMAQLLANASVDLGPKGVDSAFGAGLVDAVAALKSGDTMADIVTGSLKARAERAN